MTEGQPVRELQEMLQFLSFTDPGMPQIIPDGRFGERTLESVMIFQRDHKLPVTGVVDFETWSAIREAYRGAYHRNGAPTALRVLCNGKACVQSEEPIPPVPIVQAMFDALALYLSNFKATEAGEVYQSNTEENTRQLQRVYALEQTGVMDRAAWEGLARLYQLIITRKVGERMMA